MLKRVLIANRGEIALSIFRACREMGIETVAAYSEADSKQPVVFLADSSVCIGGARGADSYLNMRNIVAAALASGCDGIHPGYGFLSENPEFARMVEQSGIKLVGPSAATISVMGDKLSARRLMQESGVPVVPGCDIGAEDAESLREAARVIGYPILLKAASGGGGKGMRRVYTESELTDSWLMAKREAQVSFGDNRIYAEKLIEEPRHIEIQILADSFGNIVHLYERECSIQRNNQKILEEAPCAFLPEELLLEMREAAVRCASACGYEGAGTVEFIVDKSGNFYFMEMNTRIQVEHPVTEMITGINLVKEQLRIAAGLKIRYSQEGIKKDGHAIEIRVNAQNPFAGFAPSCGRISFYLPPGGFNTRFEGGIYHGAEILPYYDSMLGKLIVKGRNRLEAIKMMRRAIEETVIDGVDTNLGFHYALLHEVDFIKGDISTSYLEKHEKNLIEKMMKIENSEA